MANQNQQPDRSGDHQPDRKRRYDVDVGIVYLLIMFAVLAAFMLWLYNQPP